MSKMFDDLKEGVEESIEYHEKTEKKPERQYVISYDDKEDLENKLREWSKSLNLH